MNLATATRMVLEELSLAPTSSSPLKKALPWRQSLGLNRREEDVRPIFWRNRNHSYIARTQDWDEFPNGRWGDSRSPAFGEIDAYGIGLKGSNQQNVKLWGHPTSVRDLSNLFVRFLDSSLDRLPWSESPLSAEASPLKSGLLSLNQRGLLTINSQPAINGVPSSDPAHGWGPPNGYVYQKAYLELFVPPQLIHTVIDRITNVPDLTFYAVNQAGELHANTKDEGPNAVTWGIFPNREIVQPTIVETVSFLAWKDEAYRLGEDWSKCYPPSSASRRLIGGLVNNWWLVNIVDNDFHKTGRIFDTFEGLEVEDMDKTVPGEAHADGAVNGEVNGKEKGKPESDKTSEARVGDIKTVKSHITKAEERNKSPLRN